MCATIIHLQVSSKLRNRDDCTHSARLKLLDVALQLLGRAMRREHQRFMLGAQVAEHQMTSGNDFGIRQ